MRRNDFCLVLNEGVENDFVWLVLRIVYIIIIV